MWRVCRTLHEIYENVLALTVGDDDADTSQGCLGCGRVFGVHASTAESAFLWLDVFAKVTARRHLADELGFGIIGMGGEDAVYIRKQDECVGFHHLCDES